MNISRLMRWSTLLCVLLGWSVSGAIAQDQPKVITLGADLTPEQRQALLQTFGAREGIDKILTVDTTEMRASMQDIIPVPEGYTSVSSTALTCGTPGSGLRVTTENITRVSAGMYAGALLTAGIGDAGFIVAAPAAAQAEGMTALTGIFKGFQGGACGRGEIEPARRELAYRWLATTERLAGTTGDETAAANLMLRAQEKLVEGGRDPAGVEPALDAVASESGVAVPADQRAGLVELLRGMAEAKIDWGTYAKGWEVQQVSPNEVRLTATNLQPDAEATAAGGAAPAAALAGTTVQGTLRASITAGAPFTVEVDGQSRELTAGDGNIPVTRDGQPAQLADIQPGDNVTVRLRPDSVVEAIDARSAGPANANPGSGAMNAAGRVVVGMVEANTNGQINLQTGGATQQFAVPAAARVVREGREAQVGAVQARDSAVVVLDPTGKVEAVFARPGDGNYVLEGVAPGVVNGQMLPVQVGEQTIDVPLANGEVPVTRDGRAAQLADIQPNDRVTVRFDESNRPVAIDAQRAAAGFNWRRLWWLPLLLPLLLLPLLGRRRTQTIVVEPGQRTVVDGANPGKAIAQARDGQPTHRTRS